jgi:hypothetical protein
MHIFAFVFYVFEEKIKCNVRALEREKERETTIKVRKSLELFMRKIVTREKCMR